MKYLEIGFCIGSVVAIIWFVCAFFIKGYVLLEDFWLYIKGEDFDADDLLGGLFFHPLLSVTIGLLTMLAYPLFALLPVALILYLIRRRNINRKTKKQ